MLIIVKMPIVGILAFMSRINFYAQLSWAWFFFNITSGPASACFCVMIKQPCYIFPMWSLLVRTSEGLLLFNTAFIAHLWIHNLSSVLLKSFLLCPFPLSKLTTLVMSIFRLWLSVTIKLVFMKLSISLFYWSIKFFLLKLTLAIWIKRFLSFCARLISSRVCFFLSYTLSICGVIRLLYLVTLCFLLL